MNRGLLVWLGVAVVLGMLSAAIVRLVVHGGARAPAAQVRRAVEPPSPRAAAHGAPTPGPDLSGAARPDLVALRVQEIDRREARLARRLRALSTSSAPYESEAPERRPTTDAPATEEDAGAAPHDAGAPAPDAGFVALDAGVTVTAHLADAGPAPALAHLRVVLADENDAWLKLVSVDVTVDHVQLVSRAAPDGLTLDDGDVAYNGALFAGSHFVEANFVYRGAGGVFGYLDGYSLRVTGREAITVARGGTTTLRVSSVDRGAIYELDKRPKVLITAE